MRNIGANINRYQAIAESKNDIKDQLKQRLKELDANMRGFAKES